ncbi:hypothetical protein [Azospirillum argentinense]|uniref:hypothetical protein n=1 Tax=Azospirillum argentinense TaxID=2970906 RepID=UPI0032E029B7
MSLLPTPRQFAVDANGAPLAGAKLYFFETGTSTPKVVYADIGLSTLHPHPVVADAAGLWPAIYLGPGSYKLEMKDADGVTVWTQDSVESSSASIGTKVVTNIAALRLIRPGPESDVGQVEVLGYHQAGDGGGGLFSWDGTSSADDGGIIIKPVGDGPGRWRRVLAETIDAKWFGASPDNTAADNTAAVNAAIASAPGAATIVIGGGDFALDEAAVDPAGKNIRILLDGATINGSFPTAIKAVVEGQFQGGYRVVRSAGATSTDFADHFSFRRADYEGGSESYVNALRRHQTEVGPDAASSEWVGVYVLDNRSPHGQNIALMAQGHKRPGAGHTWTMHAEHLDYEADPTTASVIAETGFRGNGPDTHGNRVLWDMSIAKRNGGDGTTPEVAWGLRIGPSYGDPTNGKLGFGLSVLGDARVVLYGEGESTNTVDSAFARDVGEREFGVDLAGATYRSGVAYRMRAGDKLALEETDVISLRWDPSSYRAELLNGGTALFSAGLDGLRGNASPLRVTDTAGATERPLADWLGGVVPLAIGSVEIAATVIPSWVTAFATPARDRTKPEKGGGARWVQITDDGSALQPYEARDAGGRRWMIAEQLMPVGATSEGDFAPTSPQFQTTNTHGALNQIKFHASVNGNSPALEAVGYDQHIGLNYVAKGEGLHLLGNGYGTALQTEGLGEAYRRHIYIRPGNAGSLMPRLRSDDGLDYETAEGKAHRYIVNGSEVLSIVKSYSGTPHRLGVDAGQNGVTIGATHADGTSSARLTLLANGTGIVSTWHLRQYGRSIRPAYHPTAPASGSTLIWPTYGVDQVLIVNGSTLASLTIVLPADPDNGLEVGVTCQSNVTSLTVQAAASPAGTSVVGAPTTLTPATPFRMRYAGDVYNRWMRV